MSGPKNQHFVPRFYLNAFAIPESIASGEPKVYALGVHSDDDDQFIASTKNVAAEKFLYSPVGDDNKRDFTFEGKLADLEALLSQLWRELATGCISLEDGYRKGLAMFIANLYLRHPRKRKVTRARLSHFQGAIQAHLTALGDSCQSIEFTLNNHKASVTLEEFEAEKAVDDNDYHKHFVEYVESNTIDLAKILLKRRWNVIVSPKRRFITSDNPVCLTGPAHKPFGFETEGTVITL